MHNLIVFSWKASYNTITNTHSNFVGKKGLFETKKKKMATCLEKERGTVRACPLRAQWYFYFISLVNTKKL